jgi:hypothetical protein
MHGKGDKILAEKPKRNRPLGRLNVYERILLKCILKKQGVRMWNGFIWLRTDTSGGML